MFITFLTRGIGRLRTRWRGGLRLRTTMVVVVMLGVTAPASFLFIAEQRLTEQAQLQQMEHSELALMSMGGLLLHDTIWNLDYEGNMAVAKRLLENPQVTAVAITAIPATLSLHAVRPGYTLELATEVMAGRASQRKQQLMRGEAALGTLTVWFDRTYSQNLLQQRRTQMLVLVAAQAMAILLLLVWVLVARVLKPIERLKEQASALLRHEDDVAAVPEFVWTRRDELGLLGRHLSQVQTQLRELFRQLSAKNDMLQQLALYDPLTSLPNRSLFRDLVQREILLAQRNKQRFAIFFMDLDRFKSVNDSLGHAAGDVLLMEVAQRLRSILREMDVVCRQSGDEFLIMARDVEHWEALGDVAQRILQAVEVPVPIKSSVARVSASIGIALYPSDAHDFDTLLKNADAAMYQAKALGRARYSFFHAALNARLQTNIELDNELGNAIATNQLVLHYQPQVDAKTGALVGLEALVRWQHPTRGLLYPGHFIGIAEESGKIADMGAWTMQEACRQMAQWRTRGIHVGCMSVNVSALEFRDHRLLQSLQSALASSGIAPHELEIEITESVLMAETDTSQRIIERVRQLGVGIAIDDFGTGYSSLAYLKRLHPNQLKIDQSFVADTTTDNDSRAIVNGVVGLAQALGLEVVAEGVETQEQQDFLRASGCNTLQGYFISRPLAVPQLELWIQARAHTTVV